MSEEIAVAKVEISAPVETKAPEAPTKGDLEARGWNAKDIKSAEKFKMVKPDPIEKGPEHNGTEPAKPEDLNVKPEVVETPEVVEEKKPEVKTRGGIPDYNLSPEQEAMFFKIFPRGTPQNGTYLRMKTERQARQAVEARNRELEAQIEALKTVKPQVEVDENGQEIDPDNEPLTPKKYKAMLAREAEEKAEQERKNNERAMRMTESFKDQEDYAKSVHSDYAETMVLAKEVITNFETLGLAKWQQDQVRSLYQQLQAAASRADEIEIDAFTPPLIGYEIGKFHPNYKPSNGPSAESHTDGKQDPNKANGSLTPEQMKRAVDNTQRRPSSASIPGGGGKRSVSPEEVTLAEFAKFDAKQRYAFREKHPEAYARISRG